MGTMERGVEPMVKTGGSLSVVVGLQLRGVWTVMMLPGTELDDEAVVDKERFVRGL
jgi:hypothetical protein